MAEKIKTVVITGPTATGKTALAVKLARLFPAEIVSVDSRQVYRGMDIGTGKDLDEYGEVPYHLIDIADPQREVYNLARFLRDAFRALFARAHVVTPNITEAALLTGEEYRPAPHDAEYVDKLFCGLERLGPKVAAITGVHPSTDEIGTVVRDFGTGESYAAMDSALEGVFYGTGDIFASAFAALLVRGAGAGRALEAASALVRESIERSFRRDTPRPWGVDFEGALPAYVRRVEAIFSPST